MINHRILVITVVVLSLVIASSATAADPLAIEFHDANKVRLEHDAATTRIIESGDRTEMEITAGSKGSWPGVILRPREGLWDLSQYDMVEVDVFNPQAQPVRVLLSLADPQGDGRSHTNTESVNVPAKSEATLTVPFGAWHGEMGHEIDRDKIAMFKIMLDRPGKEHTFRVANLRAVKFNRAGMKEVFDTPFYAQLKPVFGRGINLGNALEAPREGEWGVTLKESYFTEIARAGFDSVRVPIRWSAHAKEEAPYTIDPKFFERVDWVVEQCLSRDLEVVINVHHYYQLMERPAEHRKRFVALWKQIAEHYRVQSDALAFELLNEPQSRLDADAWNAVLADALGAVRESNPKRTVVIGPANFNQVSQLVHLKLPAEDRNLVVTIHYYGPHSFTHQGAHWLDADAQRWLGTKWIGTPAEKQAIMREFDQAIRWAVEHRRPIYLGEFGAYHKADLESRARWTKYIAQEALERKMGFAYWEFCSGFGAYDAERGEWIEPLRQSLLSN